MAERPVFQPGEMSGPVVRESIVSFRWIPGLALSQKQKCLREFHAEAERRGYGPILEISTKSDRELGRELSAFALTLNTSSGDRIPVEVAYQAAKTFSAGPASSFTQGMKPREARKLARDPGLGRLLGFDFEGEVWDLNPATAFYDWLYVSALIENPQLAIQLQEYRSFTDLEFNPKRQVSCQARAAALFVCLTRRGLIGTGRLSREVFIEVVGQIGSRGLDQHNLLR